MLNELQILLMSIFFLGVFADVFFIWKNLDWGSDIRLFCITAFWLVVGKMFRLTSIATFKVTLVFLVVLSIFFIFLRDHPSVERLASWVYVFLAVGVVQLLFESRKNQKTSHV